VAQFSPLLFLIVCNSNSLRNARYAGVRIKEEGGKGKKDNPKGGERGGGRGGNRGGFLARLSPFCYSRLYDAAIFGQEGKGGDRFLGGRGERKGREREERTFWARSPLIFEGLVIGRGEERREGGIVGGRKRKKRWGKRDRAVRYSFSLQFMCFKYSRYKERGGKGERKSM